MKNAPARSLTIAPGSVVLVRDEEWLVTEAKESEDGLLVTAHGLSELVRDTTATFYSAIDEIEELDPAEARVVADDSPGFRRAKLWLEATLRKTNLPLSDPTLGVSTQMLVDPLGYQRTAVSRALDPANLRPRLLIADAVGLGKTIEIGMILAELARRGRGERILIVTPRHVLEQMQKEMWNRFQLPFVRLDSLGIQRIRQQIPATRNPFSYYKRVIVSIDTLKADHYAASLRKVHWDAVVIDEAHNVTNQTAIRHRLASLLAARTDALILASATPHNGKEESFAEMVRLLDPSAVSAGGEIDKDRLPQLIIRRHRHSPEVAAEVGGDWAERRDPQNFLVPASAAEDAIADELAETWLYPESGRAPHSGGAARLFSWTLAKAFLSSPAALRETVRERAKRLSDKLIDETQHELAALGRLEKLALAANDSPSGKYAKLLDYLRTIGVGRNSDVRAVVFAERVATLKWLRERLMKDLSLSAEGVALLHGGLTDVEQQAIVESFKQAGSPIRVLVTGDVASEGVNLHSQCHELIHFDIPWSLIRIEQRNGRIDRYGQRHAPQISTLLLQPSNERFSGDVKVLTRLMEKEHEAHGALGDVTSIMGKHDVKAEEDLIAKVLAGESELDDVTKSVEVAAAADTIDGFLASLMMAAGRSDPSTSESQSKTVATLYPDAVSFLSDALNEVYETPAASVPAGGVEWKHHDKAAIAQFSPPSDLTKRLRVLPQTYVTERVRDTIKLATDRTRGNAVMAAAMADERAVWPEASFLGPMHPVLDWASDRALARLGRNQVFAVHTDIDAPLMLLLGTLTNKRGQTVSTAFLGAMFPNGAQLPLLTTFASASDALEAAGTTRPLTNSGSFTASPDEDEFVPAAVRAARGHLQAVFAAAEEATHRRIEQWAERTTSWEREADALIQRDTVRARRSDIRRERELAEAMAPTRSLVRPLILALPTGYQQEVSPRAQL